MRSIRYLNTVLTILTVLLALQLWTTWTTVGADHGLTVATPAQAVGIPNGGAQREQMISLLKQQVAQTKTLTSMFRTGEARVKLEAAPGGGK